MHRHTLVHICAPDAATGIEGFDLDGRASRSDSPGADECAHDDCPLGACTAELGGGCSPTAFCIEPCLPPNSGSQECANCAFENCIDVNACTGLY